jgi:hypothetical protein
MVTGFAFATPFGGVSLQQTFSLECEAPGGRQNPIGLELALGQLGERDAQNTKKIAATDQVMA